MSGFLVADERSLPIGQADVLKFYPGDQVMPWQWSGWLLQLVRQDASALWAPAWCDSKALGLAIWGRARLAPAQWEAAKRLPFTGGLASRYLLGEYLRDGDAGLQQALNGAAVVLLWDGRQRALHLWTDRAGVIPVYQAQSARLALSSHPDTLADWLIAQGQRPTLDPASMAELLSTGAVSSPYSLYKELRLLPQSTHFVWHANGDAEWHLAEQSVYWQAPGVDERLNRDSAAEGIAEALKAACQRQPPGKTVLLLSGGADSRGLLFAHPQPAELECVTFCDRENDEVARARDIAAVAGVKHEVWQRDPEHYGLGALETIRATSGMGSIKDAHFAGFHTRLAALGASSIVTGCYADYLLKGLALNRVPYQFLGRELPVERLAPYAPDFYQPAFQLAERWNQAVIARRVEREGALAAERYAQSPRAIESVRVFPLAREADSMGRLYLQSSLPWDPVFADRDLLDFYGRLSPALKLNSEAFALAVLRLVPERARAIPNNNDGQFPLGMSVRHKLVSSAFSLVWRALSKRFSAALKEESLASWCSWPNFAYYVGHSQKLGELWAEHAASNDPLLADLLGRSLDSRSQIQWAAQPSLYLRLLTLRVWLASRGY